MESDGSAYSRQLPGREHVHLLRSEAGVQGAPQAEIRQVLGRRHVPINGSRPEVQKEPDVIPVSCAVIMTGGGPDPSTCNGVNGVTGE